jgi:WhiB family transcriptional regulator, redox-sensing transcriptional regulator
VRPGGAYPTGSLVRALVRAEREGLASPLGGGVVIQPVEETWQVRAACKGPQAAAFFPPTHAERKEEKAAREARAKTICETCVVRCECLEYAVRIREPHGIWGGLNETERKQLLERRAG